MTGAGKNIIISESEYQDLVEIASDRTNNSYIPRILVEDYASIENRSFLGRYFFRIAKDYANAVKVLSTVVHNPMTCEDFAWCRFDYAVACYRLTGDVDTALKRVYVVRQWALNNADLLMFLSLDEVEQVLKMLNNEKNS